jgi:hypothetical protein
MNKIMPIIAVCITTFLRDSLLYKTLQTITDNYTNNCIVLIADQGYASSEKNIQIDYFKSQIPLEYYQIPFDSGLSYARNFLINKANEMNIPYILLGADSIQFIQKYDFTPIINFLEQDEKRGIVGCALENSKCPWEFLLEVIPQGIKFTCSKNHVYYNNIDFLKVDICRNIFLAKTSTLLNLWDEELKLCEHEDAFITYKNRGFEVYWTNSYVFKKVSSNTSEEYKTYRKRLQDYQKILKQKLHISGWIIYSPEVMREIQEYKRKNNL